MKDRREQINPSGVEIVDQLRAYAARSRAVDHPYLKSLASGALPNIPLALLDFARHYSDYSSRFTEYLALVIRQLSNPHHKEALLENMREEHGAAAGLELSPELMSEIDGVPHKELFQRFIRALTGYTSGAFLEHSSAGKVWQHQFTDLCGESPYAGVGALGIATEMIVPDIYSNILLAIERHTQLLPAQYVFFTLHAGCDDEHAEVLLAIAQELLIDEASAAALTRGVNAAIAMRERFWDCMLDRAIQMPVAVESFTETIGELEA